jgi:hypothetical protein
VAASSPGDYRDLFLTFVFRICADDNFIPRQESQTWMKYGQAL